MSSMSMSVVVGGAILVILVSNGPVVPVEGSLYKARRIVEAYHKIIDNGLGEGQSCNSFTHAIVLRSVADVAGKSEQDLVDSDMDFESMINGVNSFEHWAKNSILCDSTKDLYCHQSGKDLFKGRCRRCSESPDERQCNDVKRIKDAENGSSKKFVAATGVFVSIAGLVVFLS